VRSDGRPRTRAPKSTLLARLQDTSYLWSVRLDPKGNASTLPAARQRKYFASIRTAKPAVFFDSTDPLRASHCPLTPKAALYVGNFSRRQGLPGSLLPARNPLFFDPKNQIHLGTSLFSPDGTLYVATGDKGQVFAVRARRQGRTVSTPATKLTFACWHSTQKATSSPARKPSGRILRIFPEFLEGHPPRIPRILPHRKPEGFVLYETSRT